MNIASQVIKTPSKSSVISIDKFLFYVQNLVKRIKPIKTNKKIEYYNIPCAFDIETSSFYQFTGVNKQKVAIMYEWTFAIYDHVTIGRTWNEFIFLINKLIDMLDISPSKRLIIYVHNLAFEFQFMRKHFLWKKVFSLKERKPIQAITEDGIEFRCSYKLSGYSLSKLSDQLQKYKIHKMDGDLDYRLIRHSLTPLTKKELGYCINDVLVVNCYIQELIEHEGDITKLPLTKTGFVRNLTRKNCLYSGDNKYGDKYRKYRKMMNTQTLTPEIYKQLRRAFSGGFTHANPFYVKETVKNVDSYDFTSSYPYVMVTEKFPMSAFTTVNLTSMEQFERLLSSKACLFDVEIEGLESKIYFENYLSQSHCTELENAVINNGRIVSATHLKTTMTEQDYFIFNAMYDFDNIKIYNFRTAIKAYLPTDFVLTILDLYNNKTQLKDVIGKEVEYLKSKENVNAMYGMCVTDIVRDEIIYDEEDWGSEKPDLEEAINRYNTSKKRFLNYAWGVWVTAYARANLFTGILEFGDDYIYADTDSIKVLNADKHKKYFEWYQQQVDAKLYNAANFHKIDISKFSPKNIYGEEKKLGVWEHEKKYLRFKTLGAKRYLVEYEEKDKKSGFTTVKQKLTVAGLNKQNTMGYIKKVLKKDAFDVFNEELYIPTEYYDEEIGDYISATGKQTHTYIDNEMEGCVQDYLGNICEYHELSGVHLENADYDFSMSEQFIRYIFNIKSEKIE